MRADLARLAAILRKFRRVVYSAAHELTTCPYASPERDWRCIRPREHPGPHQLGRVSRPGADG